MDDQRKVGKQATQGAGARFGGLTAASAKAAAAARGSSRKRDTLCEVQLRRSLWARGLRYRVDVATLPGRPDIVFARARVVVFCDGDFWHGRDLNARLQRLAVGHNAGYWTAKIARNVERDRRQEADLSALGWRVLRFWESEIRRDAEGCAARVAEAVRAGAPDVRG